MAHRRGVLPGSEDRLIEFVIIIGVLSWMGGFGLAVAKAATRLDRAAPTWFAFGAILGPIALVLLEAGPPGRCRACGTPTRGWLRICFWCGEDVTSTPASTSAIVARMSASAELAEVSGGRPLAEPVEPARPFQLPSAAFRPSTRATLEAPTPLGTSTTPRPTSASQPTAAWPPFVLDRDASPAGPGGAVVRASKVEASGELVTVATRVLATAVYVTGSARLEAGRRYGIAVHGSRLQVLGPVDIDPFAIALDRPMADIDASTAEGRLIVAEPRTRSGLVLAFMSVAGATTDDLANLLFEAARESIEP